MLKLAYKIEEKVSLLSSVLDSLPIPAVLFNEHHEIVHINTEFTEWFMINNLSNDVDVFNNKINELLSNELENILEEVNGKNRQFEKNIVIRTKIENHESCIASCKRIIIIDGVDGLVLFFQNNRGTDEHVSYYREKANLDPLTHILNRFGFYETFQDTISKQPLEEKINAVVMGDLDGLKAINDRYGHNQGDKAIKSAVKGILGSLRNNDIVARWGGDEFIIVLIDVFSMNHVNKLLKRISVNVETKSKEDGFPIKISLGAALWSEDGESLEELIDVADKRMYKQKSINRFM